jgi:hypothetical protein
MIVDDHAVIRRMLCVIFEAEYLRVCDAADGTAPTAKARLVYPHQLAQHGPTLNLESYAKVSEPRCLRRLSASGRVGRLARSRSSSLPRSGGGSESFFAGAAEFLDDCPSSS